MCLLLPYILPPQMTTEFIEQRRAALTIFINRVVRSMGGMQHCCQLAAAQACVPAHCPSGQHASSTTAAHPLPGPTPQAAHPALKASPDLQLFLEASETEFGGCSRCFGSCA